MELLIIPLLIWIVKLFIGVIKLIFRGVCFVLGCIGLGVDTARSRSAQRKRAELKQKELDWKMQLEQAKQARIDEDRIARIERERRKEERAEIEWQWKVQKEADRRAELEWKRKRREQIDKERREKQRGGDDIKKRLARDDLDYLDQAMQDITPLVDKYRETFEQTVTDKTREQAYKKLYQLEARQHRLDKARQKAIYQLGGV